MRAAVFSERLWNMGVDDGKELLSIATRLIAHNGRMKGRGYSVEPVTVGLC